MPLDGAKLDDDARTLLRAAEIIERGGHCRQVTEDGDAHCTAAAIVKALGASWIATPVERLDAFAIRCGFGDCIEMFDWNDVPGRTKEQVIARLRSAAMGDGGSAS